MLEWWHYVDANFMFMCIFCSLCKLRVYSFCEFLCSVARSMAELSYPINLLNKYVFVYVKQQLLDRCCAVCSSQGSWRENESAVAWIRISNCKSMTIVFLFSVFLCLRYPTLTAKALCFRTVCPPRSSVRSFVRTDFVTTICRERLEPSRWNLQRIFTSPYWYPD